MKEEIVYHDVTGIQCTYKSSPTKYLEETWQCIIRHSYITLEGKKQRLSEFETHAIEIYSKGLSILNYNKYSKGFSMEDNITCTLMDLSETGSPIYRMVCDEEK